MRLATKFGDKVPLQLLPPPPPPLQMLQMDAAHHDWC
jgi:hypothetical protein